MLTLYQFEISPFCDKIRRILNLKRIPYRIHEVGLLEAQTSYRRKNPTGKCPAIEDDGHLVCDSTDIAYWIEERWPEPPLIPADPRERALVHVLEDWADESLYFYELYLRFLIPHNAERSMPKLLAHESAWMKTAAPWFLPRLLAGQARSQGVARKSEPQALADVGRHLDSIAALLEGREWLVGERLSLADVSVFTMVFCIRDSREGAVEIERRPALVTWMDRVDRATRPAEDRPASASA